MRSCKTMTTPVSAPKTEAESSVQVEPVGNVDITSDEPNTLQQVFHEIKQYLSTDVLRDMVSKMNAVCENCKGDGAGLTGGVLIDMFLTAYLSDVFGSFEECRSGESDCKILGIPLSIKKN